MITQIYTTQTADEALALVEAGVDHIGTTPTACGLPGEISVETCKTIFDAIDGRAVKCALTVADEADEILTMVKALRPDVLHICGNRFYATPKFVKEVKALVPGIRVMQAIPMTGPEAVDVAVSYGEFCDILILDSVSPTIDGIGAAGVTHDWNDSKKIVERSKAKVILAGGLGPDNVAEAIKFVKPWGVDSLTKTNKFAADGTFTKDIEKVKAFVKNAKNA